MHINGRTFVAAVVGLMVSACGGGYQVFDGDTVSGTVTWSGITELRRSVTINGTLTLAPCAQVLMPGGANLLITDRGALRAVGTADCPVVIQSVKSAPAAGDWGRIDITATASNDTLFKHAEVRHGSGVNYGVVWVDSGASVGFEQVKFSKSANTSIQFEEGARASAFTGVTFDDCAGELVRAPPAVVAQLSPVVATNTTNPRVVLSGADSKAAATWKNLGVPLEVPSMNIISGVIEVEAGTTLKLAPQAVVAVRDGGGFRALGTAEKPVIIESAKTSPAAGDWRRFDLYATSTGTNLLRHTTVRHAGDSLYGVMWLEQGATLTLENATFTSNASCDLGGDSNPTATSSTFTRCP
jgi:hypothetical protein